MEAATEGLKLELTKVFCRSLEKQQSYVEFCLRHPILS